MDDSSFVDIGEAQRCLKEYAFHLFLSQTELLLLIELKRVFGEILKNDARFSLWRVLFEVEQAHDVGVVKVFEEISLLEGDLLVGLHELHGRSLPRLHVAHEVNCAEITAAHLLQHLVFVHRRIIYTQVDTARLPTTNTALALNEVTDEE